MHTGFDDELLAGMLLWDNCDIMYHAVMQSQFGLHHCLSCLSVDGTVLSCQLVLFAHHITSLSHVT